jgi:hypothetical protein
LYSYCTHTVLTLYLYCTHTLYSYYTHTALILHSYCTHTALILHSHCTQVLYACIKRKLTNDEIKVAQLAGYCSEHTAYHHGEVSLHSAIVNMAQDYVGSNNLPLLEPSGQFGTRLQGGKDAASARYIYTKLAPHTRLLVPEADDAVLEYRTDDGLQIEPIFYVPILPMLLGTHTVLTMLYSYCTHYAVLILYSLCCTHTVLMLYSYCAPTVPILYSFYAAHAASQRCRRDRHRLVHYCSTAQPVGPDRQPAA